MRAAVNHTVSTVVCDLNGPRFENEVETAFPTANKLHISWNSWEATSAPDFCLMLKNVLATSPGLVTKLVDLRLSVRIASIEDIAPAIASFLSRCVHSGMSHPAPPWFPYACCTRACIPGRCEGSTLHYA
jgi:hypothetical protein